MLTNKMKNQPLDFYEGDIITLKSAEHWGKRYLISAMEFDYTTLSHFCTVVEIGSNFIRTNVEYDNLRYLVCNVEKTKLGRLLYGWHPKVESTGK